MIKVLTHPDNMTFVNIYVSTNPKVPGAKIRRNKGRNKQLNSNSWRF